MAQCTGRSERTGARCKRSASGNADTCYYHGQRAATRPAVAVHGAPLPASDVRSLTADELCERTWDDFEALFAEGTGWGRCGCLFALDARRSTRRGTWAEQRRANLDTMRGLVDAGRSQGVLVYRDDQPIGWCQYVPKDELRFTARAAAGADWFITCFVNAPAFRGVGVTSVALDAALDAIGRRGGGVVEGHATAMVPGPPRKADRTGTYIEDDILFHGGSAKAWFGLDVDGVGPVTALFRSKRSMHGAPLGGTMDVYRAAGFEAVEVLERKATGQLADRIVMRRSI